MTPTTRTRPCPHGPHCDPSDEVLDPYTDGPDGPTALVCLVHDNDHPDTDGDPR